LLAKRFGAEEIINASNTPYLYNKDFKKYKDALPIKSISWEGYQKIVGKNWFPGLSTPFDPIASETAKKLKIRTFIVKGTDLKNFENLIAGKKFRGSIIG
jgi:uridylate kinase